MPAAISVVMVSYRTGPILFDAIRCALAQPELHELILVDNGNPAPVVAELEHQSARDSRLILRSGHGNIGFAAGCNLGARCATGDYLLLLNPDCRLPAGALAALLAEGRRQRRPWLLGARLINPDGSEQRGARRAMLTPWSALIETCRLDRLTGSRIARVNLNEAPVPARTTAVPVISGACMMLPVADYWRIGGMDEDYFLHVEDIDFCHRFAAAGGNIAFVPHVSILHHKGSSEADRVTVEWHKARGFIRHFRKNTRPRNPLLLALVYVGVLARFAAVAGGIGAGRLAARLADARNRRGPAA